MTTFSQMVDSIVSETRRPDFRETIAGYVNQAIREMHMGQNGAVQRFNDNLVEVILEADAETGFQYELPLPHRFQVIEAVWYATQGVYADYRTPQSAFAFRDRPSSECYFYRSGSNLIFNGYGGQYSEIALAYFQFPTRLKYFAAALRPATWDDSAGWSYLLTYDVSAATRLNARELSTNWLLDRWEDMISQNVRAKVWARLNDTERAKVAFSASESLKSGLIVAEGYTGGTRYRS